MKCSCGRHGQKFSDICAHGRLVDAHEDHVAQKGAVLPPFVSERQERRESSGSIQLVAVQLIFSTFRRRRFCEKEPEKEERPS